MSKIFRGPQACPENKEKMKKLDFLQFFLAEYVLYMFSAFFEVYNSSVAQNLKMDSFLA